MDTTTIRDPLGFLIELFYDLDQHPDCDIDRLMDRLFAVPVLQPLLATPVVTQYGIATLILPHRSPRLAAVWHNQICPAWNVRARNLKPIT